MKNYVAPEMEMLAFAAEEPVAGLLDGLISGNRFNDTEFGGY